MRLHLHGTVHSRSILELSPFGSRQIGARGNNATLRSTALAMGGGAVTACLIVLHLPQVVFMAPLQELSRSHKVLDHGQMVKDGLLLIAAASNDNTSDGNADDSMPSLPPTPPLDDGAPSLPPLAPDESAPSMPPLSPPSIPPMSMDHSSQRDESSPWRMTGMFLAVVGLGAFLLICILNAAAAWAESAWDEGAWGETAWAAADTIIHKGGTSLEGGKGKQSPEHFAASTYLDLRSRIESTKDEEALLQRETRIGLLATSQSSHQGPTDKAVEDTSVVNDSVEPVDDDEPADEEEHVDPTSYPRSTLGCCSSASRSHSLTGWPFARLMAHYSSHMVPCSPPSAWGRRSCKESDWAAVTSLGL